VELELKTRKETSGEGMMKIDGESVEIGNEGAPLSVGEGAWEKEGIGEKVEDGDGIGEKEKLEVDEVEVEVVDEMDVEVVDEVEVERG